MPADKKLEEARAPQFQGLKLKRVKKSETGVVREVLLLSKEDHKIQLSEGFRKSRGPLLIPRGYAFRSRDV